MRIPIDPGPFADLMPKGSSLYMAPTLPTITYKKNGVEYTMTDLRYLNEAGVQAFRDCVEHAANDKTIKEVIFLIPDGMEKEKVEIVCDILLGFSIEAKKKGRKGWHYQGRFLVYGLRREKDKDGDRLIAELVPEAVEAIASIAREKGKVDITDAIERYIDEMRQDLEKVIQ